MSVWQTLVLFWELNIALETKKTLNNVIFMLYYC